MKPEEELMDALLKEQARKRDADEELLAGIGKVIDAAAGRKAVPGWRRVMPLSIAAALVMSAAVVYQPRRNDGPDLAMDDAGRSEALMDTAMAPAAAVAKLQAPAAEGPAIADAGRAGTRGGGDAFAAAEAVPAGRMERGLALGGVMAVPPMRVPVDFEPGVADNDFSRLNPDYKQRIGSFHERTHLPGSAELLFEVCSIEARLHPYVMEILRAFVYERAEAFVKGDGGISAEELEGIVKRMDDRLLALMDEGQRERFPAWREADDGANPLRFLMDLGAAEPAQGPGR